MLKIAIIGDYQPEAKAHIAIPQAIALAAEHLQCQAELRWLPTPELNNTTIPLLSGYDAVWAAPATPYIHMEGALQAIRYAREQQIPTLGTCGGYQHLLIEFARHVLYLQEADHAESNPEATTLIVTPLTCSINEQTHHFTLKPHSKVATIYGTTEISEQYGICNYGLNAQYVDLFAEQGFAITGRDLNGEARIAELENHPFYVGTLFQPERSAFRNIVHPLIRAFLHSALSHSQTAGTFTIPSSQSE